MDETRENVIEQRDKVEESSRDNKKRREQRVESGDKRRADIKKKKELKTQRTGFGKKTCKCKKTYLQQRYGN